MGEDAFPYKHLVFRILDIALYTIVALISALLFLTESGMATAKIGLLILVLGLYQEYRQQNYYSKDSIERSLLSSSLVIYPINDIAKLRNYLSRGNIILIIFGTILSGWGVFG